MWLLGNGTTALVSGSITTWGHNNRAVILGKETRRGQTKWKKNRVWSSPCENSPCCEQSLEGRGRATTFSPSRADLRWLSNPRKELLFWTRGKHTSSLWSPSSSSTVWLLLVDTIRWWKKRDSHRFKERKSRKKMFCLLLFIFIYSIYTKDST